MKRFRIRKPLPFKNLPVKCYESTGLVHLSHLSIAVKGIFHVFDRLAVIVGRIYHVMVKEVNTAIIALLFHIPDPSSKPYAAEAHDGIHRRDFATVLFTKVNDVITMRSGHFNAPSSFTEWNIFIRYRIVIGSLLLILCHLFQLLQLLFSFLILLFRNTKLPEGDLTKIRASLVCEKSLFEWAKTIRLGDYLLLGHGEDQSGGRERPSVLSDAFEAGIAAIFLDGGMEAAEPYILRFLPEHFDRPSGAFHDYKTVLQEVIQQNPEEHVEYVLVGEEGPDHAKQFHVEVRLNSNVIGKGSGRSKKTAEQNAAKEALLLMGEKV